MKRIITNLVDGFYFKKIDDENISPEEAIEGFDGGRLLRCLLCLTAKEADKALLRAERVLSLCSAACLLALWFFSVYLLLRAGTALSLYLFCAELFFTLYEPQKSRAASHKRHRTEAS